MQKYYMHFGKKNTVFPRKTVSIYFEISNF